MPYDQHTAERVSRILQERHADFYEKRMFGGLCFMVDDKMCVGLMYEKKRETDLLMARVGEERYEAAIAKGGAMPMDFTGRPMKGYIFVTPDGYDLESDLEWWVDQCLAFNPEAKASKKRTPKK